MKIIVCIKQILHTYAQTGISPKTYYLAPEDQISMINPYDEAALAIALSLKNQYQDVTIIL